ncbi:unnamed protein product [Schistosoma margrebowiei]|uniref:Uncharacterized protein n=1 Tax=Schistosoma margrebowiei TaxID=48269 RepID=A0A183NBP5_9TREM|nr:unnamed protein product [Schistosoma margrebowiei]
MFLHLSNTIIPLTFKFFKIFFRFRTTYNWFSFSRWFGPSNYWGLFFWLT